MASAKLTAPSTGHRTRWQTAAPSRVEAEVQAVEAAAVERAAAERLLCVCKAQDNGELLIQCTGSNCDDNWYHPCCVGISDDDLETLPEQVLLLFFIGT